jgi:hypothetical protein
MMSSASNKRLRTAYLVASYLAFLIALTRSMIVLKDDALNSLFAATVGVLVTMACVFDAAVLDRPWAFGVRLPFLIVWPFATPLYIIRSRGWRGCVILLIHACFLFAMIVAAGVVVGLMQLLGR